MLQRFITLLSLFNFFINLQAQTITIRGNATAAAGQPLIGVTVATPDHSVGTATDIRGQFQIEVPDSCDTLYFSYTGYRTLQRAIPHDKIIQVVLFPAQYQLGEVVVVGFGQQQARQLTSAISSVGEEAFQNSSVSNWEQALQGRLPGVSITSASGGLSASSSIRIRGVGSVSAGNQPLIVVDGLVLSGLGGVESLGFMTSPFININPEDIASVEVLKDAAATSIYGARGSNGVLLITTKSGQYDTPPEVNLNYYAGFSEISKRYDLLSGKEYASLWNEAAQNVGTSENLYNVEAQPETDWQSLILRRGFLQQAGASVKGGSTNSRYFISGTFRSQDAYLKTTNLQRYNLRVNYEYKINDRWAAGINLAPSRINDWRAGNQWAGSPFGWAAWYAPNINPFDEAGNTIREPLTSSNGNWGITGNPLLVLTDQEVNLVTDRLLTSSYLQFAPIERLTLKTTLATESSHETEQGYNGPATWFGRNGGSGSVQKQHITSFQWTTQADWSPSLPKSHKMDFTLGSQYIQTEFSGDYLWGSGFSSEQLQLLNNTEQVDGYFSWHTESAFLGYFARAHYTFRDKYILNLTTRYDGSSRFGTDRRFGFFPAVSAGWIAIDESLNSTVDFLKMRSSIGLTGNAEIGDFTARGLVNYNNGYLGEPGFIIESLESNQLGWEKSWQWDAGLDFAVWDKRIRGSIDYYIRDTRDLLLNVPIPATNGIGSVLENAGSIRNSGIEFDLNIDVLRGPLQWNMGFNGATLRNRILALADQNGDGKDDDIILNGRNLFRVGQPVGAFYLVRYAGVDPTNGDALFYDLEGNTLANQALSENRQIVGSPIPTFTGGITQSLKYRRFDLSAFFHFKMGHQIYLIHGEGLEKNMFDDSNQLRSQLNAWTPENTETDIPQARLGQINGSQPSTRYLHDASFLRLQNLTLAYTFPRLGERLAGLRLYAMAQNLFTVTSFPGLDPDSEFYPTQNAAQGGVLYNLPAARIFTFGLNLNL